MKITIIKDQGRRRRDCNELYVCDTSKLEECKKRIFVLDRKEEDFIVFTVETDILFMDGTPGWLYLGGPDDCGGRLDDKGIPEEETEPEPVGKTSFDEICRIAGIKGEK